MYASHLDDSEDVADFQSLVLTFVVPGTNAQHPKFTIAFGDDSSIGSGNPGEITPAKYGYIPDFVMDAAGNLDSAMNEMGSARRSFTPEGTQKWEVFGPLFCDVPCADQSPAFGGVAETGSFDLPTVITAFHRWRPEAG